MNQPAKPPTPLSAPPSGIAGPDGAPIQRSPYPKLPGIPNIRVVGPWILVLPPVKSELTRESGLVIPEQAQETVSKAVVVLVGDGRMLGDGTVLASSVEPGDEIIHARYAGIDVELQGIKYLLIQESEVRMVLTYAGKHFKFKRDEVE